MNAGTILVVEDHPTTRKLVRVTLSTAGYRVVEAGSGAEALALANSELDLLLMDLHLPDMMGFEVAERLRRDSGIECPILAFSGFLPAQEDARIASAGFTGFITKPVEPSRLLEIVRVHLPARQSGAARLGHRVLVVEDDGIQRKLVASRLARAGYRVYEAADGEAAIALLRKTPVDGVLSDVLMPRCDGFELALSIRTDPSLAHLPVVLMSAHVQERQDHRLAEAVGAHALVLRQPGAEGIETVLAESLRAGPRPCAPDEAEPLRSEFLYRIIRHLERQGTYNAHLAHQASMQSAQLEILGGMADVLTRTLNPDVLLHEMLGRTLDSLRMTKGAAYLLDQGRFRLRAHRGFDASLLAGLGDLFGHGALLDEAARGREPMFLSAGDARGATVFEAAPEAWAHDETLLITPLLSGEEVLGVWFIAGARLRPGPEWRPFALAIGSQLGQAIAVAQALAQLSASEQRAQSILEALPIGVVLLGEDGRIALHNRSAARLLGIENGTLAGRFHRDLAARMHQEDERQYADERLDRVEALQTGQTQSFVCSVEPEGGGELRWLAVDVQPLGQSGTARSSAAVISYADITDHRRVEAMLRQAQKLEAVGRLAGGIAHDFNNLLMVIGSFSELALASVAPESQLASDLEEIHRAAERATALTRQLLTFSRVQELELRILDLNTVVRDTERMLRRLIPATIRIVEVLTDDELYVRADAGSLEQVLVNLVVNAGDAMPGGGTLRLETSRVPLDAQRSAAVGLPPGTYARLDVCDTGVGMTADVRECLFDPFFTTKPPGKGTGLGLATVYGIVQQLGGAITVDSEPGRGSRFRIYLPAVDPPQLAEREGNAAQAPATPSSTILLVEDEPALRRAIAGWLRQRGHTVLEAGSGADGLLVASAYEGRIDLLLSDLTMPEMGGLELAERLRELRPGLRLLFMSGHAERAASDRASALVATECLLKPFTLEWLGVRVHYALTSPPAPVRNLQSPLRRRSHA